MRSNPPSASSCRCVSLADPLKESSRSQESWCAFLTKLRTLLLMSFTKNLGRFEDDMRTMREKRTEPGWSFCDYFMVQVTDPLSLLLQSRGGGGGPGSFECQSGCLIGVMGSVAGWVAKWWLLFDGWVGGWMDWLFGWPSGAWVVRGMFVAVSRWEEVSHSGGPFMRREKQARPNQ